MLDVRHSLPLPSGNMTATLVPSKKIVRFDTVLPNSNISILYTGSYKVKKLNYSNLQIYMFKNQIILSCHNKYLDIDFVNNNENMNEY